jgi:hypothetical protein
MKQHYPANLTNSSINAISTIAINAQMPQEISLCFKTVLARTATAETTSNAFFHALLSFSAKIGKLAAFLLECFKNQPAVFEFPTPFVIARQQNQPLQRNRFNSTTLLANLNKQAHFPHQN